MIPKRIVLENFLSFGAAVDLTFDDNEPLWVLCGPNGIGKSSVFDAITFALFGCHRGGEGQGMKELIRHGKNDFRIEFEFAFAGRDYKIIRNYGKKSVERLFRWVGEGWDEVKLTGGRNKLREWSERELGLTYDQFCASVLLKQGEADKIITAPGRERLQMLKQIIGVERYEELSARVHEATRGRKSEQDRLLKLRDNTPAVTDDEMETARIAAASAEEELGVAEAAKAVAADRVSQAKQWSIEEVNRRELEGLIAAADKRAAEAEHIRHAKFRLDELAGVVPALKQFVPLRDSLADTQRLLDEARAAHAELVARHEELKTRREALRLSSATHRDKAVDYAKDATRVRSEVERCGKFLKAAEDVAKFREQLVAFPSTLDQQFAEATELHQATQRGERAISDAKIEIETRLRDAKKEEKQFDAVEVGVKCSRCGQTVSAEHAEAERKRVADTIQLLTQEQVEAKRNATAAAASLTAAETAKAELMRKLDERAKLLQRLQDQERNLESLGSTSDVVRLKEDIVRLTAEASRFDQSGSDERTKQEAAESELTRIEPELKKMTADCTARSTERDGLDKKFVADSAAHVALKVQMPEAWRETTSDQLIAIDRELSELTRSGVAEQFRKLTEDATRRDEWGKQLSTVMLRIDAIPPEARIAIPDAERLEKASRDAFAEADRLWQQARDALATLTRRAEDFKKLLAEIVAIERDTRVHDKLDRALGPDGLQRELVRKAEQQIVRFANETVRNLSDGDLSIELDDAEEGPDKAFTLRVRRAEHATTIGVNYLSGSQKFRVAVAVALAIGRFATSGTQACPLESVIIDEGFGSLDKDGLRAMADELTRLKGSTDLKRIVLVSHQDEFVNSFPVGWRLSRSDTGTTAEKFRR